MDYLYGIVVIAIIAMVYYCMRPSVVFVIRYQQGIPRVVRGRVTEGKLAMINEICSQNQVTTGTITALPGKRIRMTFSGEIPLGCQQQIRNVMLIG